jgi:formate dehydrogenase subunit beta
MARGVFKEFAGKKGLAEALQDLWQELLERGVVKAILVPMEMEGGLVAPALLTDPKKAGASRALAPYMPVNAARVLQMMTKTQPPSEKLAVVLRSCEARALVELVKLKQISQENLIVISIDCAGTYSVEDYKKLLAAKGDPGALLVEKVNKGEEDERLREACQICLHPFAPWADIRIGFLGVDHKKRFLIEAVTENGEQLIRGLGMEVADITFKERESFIEKLLGKRKKGEQRVLKEQQEQLKGPDKLLAALSSCIRCHNCMTVCPICYCKECFFKSPTFEMEADRYMGMAEKRGAARMPADMLLFHITRMAHMSHSCVACGMCAEGCPMGVPVFKLFKAASKKVQDLFNYEPGRSLDEEIPISTFKEEELDKMQEPKI